MDRFHVYVHVAGIEANVRFHSQHFDAQPRVRQADDARRMIDDPAVNFATSTGKDEHIPITPLGLPASDEAGLSAMRERLKAADTVAVAQAGPTCCHARSDKSLAVAPHGMPRATFHTHCKSTTDYDDPAGAPVQREHCCDPSRATAQDSRGCASIGTVPAADQVVATGSSACCG
jgi:hypothetical protein